MGLVGTLTRKQRRLTRPIGHYTLGTWVLLALTILVPLLYGIYISLLDINLASFLAPQFVGLKNYTTALQASETWSTLRITIALMFLGMIVQIPCGIILAVALHQQLRGTKIFRSILITPMLLTPVAVGLTFRFMFDTDLGVINWFIGKLGIESVNWLGSQTSGLVAIVIVDSWQSIPFVMLLILAALSAIPTSLFEAATVDGASNRQVFRLITAPLITPTLLVIVMIKIMDFLKLFDTIFMLTRGGPGNATTTLGLWTYKTGFVFLELSRAAALGVIILIITMPVYFLWRKSTRNVR
ncbi:MAG: sugar ABC transporter permease [Actinobacteria bacterium]|jgi:ABC-type sugar transport system permease subunit|nr:sugar ABC transporter permease [Actinomycetota bacterium]NDH13037.1 sugar ABC transporter permease [Actinomycetota bacterium]